MKTSSITNTALKLLTTLLTMPVLAPIASATLLVNYDFDEGTAWTVNNSGSLGSAADGTLSTGVVWSTDTPSGTGSSLSIPGVSGQKVSTGSVVSGLNGLTTMTVVLWWNPASLSLSDRIISNSDGTNGFDLVVTNPSSGSFSQTNYRFQLTLDNVSVTSGDISTTGWQFIAFTYDGTLTSNNVTFYLGTTSGTVVQLGVVATANVGALGTTSKALDVGNTELNTARNPNALFDNVQIYDTVLTLTDLEALQTSTIPEPSCYAFLAGSGFLIFASIRRKPKVAQNT